MRIGIFGIGYVGCTSLVCLAELGHEVMGNDINANKTRLINEGISPIFEPGVDDLLARHRKSGRIRATTDVDEVVRWADAVLVCVGTPSSSHGVVDTSYLERVVLDLAESRLRHDRIVPILVRSTALPAIHKDLLPKLTAKLDGRQPLAYCVHPEFLRAGSAVQDFMGPPKIIFGCADEAARTACEGLYPGIEAPAHYTDPMTAALVKYADNCFHAVKVTFANEIGMLARAQGVDSRTVMELFALDTKLNISPAYLRPGLAFGGSCLPKDLRGALAWGRQNMLSLPMLEHVLPSNALQIELISGRILELRARTVGMFGLTFKDNTDDLRESPLVTLAEILAGKGVTLRVYDPALSLKRMLGSNLSFALAALPHIRDMLHSEPAEVVRDADVVVVGRSFPELDWARLPWNDKQTVLDLVGHAPMEGMPMPVVGLYW